MEAPADRQAETISVEFAAGSANSPQEIMEEAKIDQNAAGASADLVTVSCSRMTTLAALFETVVLWSTSSET